MTTHTRPYTPGDLIVLSSNKAYTWWRKLSPPPYDSRGHCAFVVSVSWVTAGTTRPDGGWGSFRLTTMFADGSFWFAWPEDVIEHLNVQRSVQSHTKR